MIITGDIKLHQVLLPVKLLFFPPPYPCFSLWKEVSIYSLYLRGRELLCSTSLRHGILLYGKFVCSPSFLYLFSLLLILAWIHGYIFYTLDYNPTLCYLSSCSNSSSSGDWELFQLATCVTFIYPCYVFGALPYFVV